MTSKNKTKDAIFDILRRDVFGNKPSRSKNLIHSMQKDYGDYVKSIKDLPNGINASSIANADKCCELLLQSVGEYLDGTISKSYITFTKAMDGIKHSLLYPRHGHGSNAFLSAFRARLDHSNSIRKRDQLFHIPISERHKISNQRFSVEGLPCLYLSNSTYVCWEELLRPNLDDIAFSGFHTYQTTNILDLTWNNEMIVKYYESDLFDIENDGIFNSYILTWPLIQACSYPSHPNHNFKAEYIVPRHLMEWTKNENIVEGIKYYSSRAGQPEGMANRYINYAFPLKDAKGEYCSNLSNKFLMTAPIHLSPEIKELDFQTLHQDVLSRQEMLLDMDLPILNMIDFDMGSSINYKDTHFSKLDLYLLSQQFEKLSAL